MAVPIIKVSELSELGVINDGDYLTILTTEGYTRKIKFSTLLSYPLFVMWWTWYPSPSILPKKVEATKLYT